MVLFEIEIDWLPCSDLKDGIIKRYINTSRYSVCDEEGNDGEGEGKGNAEVSLHARFALGTCAKQQRRGNWSRPMSR